MPFEQVSAYNGPSMPAASQAESPKPQQLAWAGMCGVAHDSPEPSDSQDSRRDTLTAIGNRSAP